MKNLKNHRYSLLVWLALLAGGIHVAAQGTAFTYQGRLNSSGGPVNGNYDLTFTLYTTNLTGSVLAGPVTNSATAVTNGLFTTLVDFGPGVFAGTSNWLEIAVRTNATGSFSTLLPRQQVTPTPYALTAESAGGLAGLVVQPNAGAAPSLIGGATNNAINTGVAGATIAGGANNVISNSSPYAFLGGGANNSIQPYADHAFLGGGGGNTIQGNATYMGSYSTLVGGYANSIWLGAFYSFLGGGAQNTIQYNAYYSTLGGGQQNSLLATYSFLGGGYANSIQLGANSSALGGGFENSILASAAFGVLGGGDANKLGGSYSTLSGGYYNQATGQDATVPGGANNLAGGNYSFAAGEQAQATNNGAFVWADAEGAPFSSTTTNQFSVRANGGVVFVTGGAGMTLDGQPVIAGPMVLTNNEPNVSLGSLTLGGGLSLPAPAGISSGGSPLLSADGNDNTYLGINAGPGGSNNTGIGYEALWFVNGFSSGGNNNSAVGVRALTFNSGSGNTANGYNALNDNTGSGNTANGNAALIYNHASDNTANGYEALGGSTTTGQLTGGNNTADGAFALLHNTSGANNVANGGSALSANTTGSENTGMGVAALGNSTSDSQLVAIGYQALQNDNAGLNENTYSGNGENTAVGYQAGQENSSGWGNSTIGYQALQDDNSGYENTAIGDAALGAVTAGYNNTAVGYNAGINITGNNNIDIGNFGVSSDNNVIRIGSGQTQMFLAGTIQGQVAMNGGLNVDSTGQNAGNIHANALTFGASSGEGVLSKRSGNYPFDVEFWTDFNERMKIAQNGNVGINTDNPQTVLDVAGTITGQGLSVNGTATVNGPANINGTATVQVLTITGGSDVAEPFTISAANQPVSAGEVVVIDEANPGQLKLTDQPYDTRVAGVVSGANGIHPGIQMHQQGLLEGGRNVALTGRVYVQADASNGAIKPGDLLTTSSTPGRAMRVSDHARAQGAILGKAMTSLKTGRGMVLVLVTLQ